MRDALDYKRHHSHKRETVAAGSTPTPSRHTDGSPRPKTTHPLRPIMHRPDAHGTLALRGPTETHSARARTTHSTPQRRHKLLTNGAAATVARGIFEVHGIAPSNVGAQLAGGREDRDQLTHGDLHRRRRGDLLPVPLRAHQQEYLRHRRLQLPAMRWGAPRILRLHQS